MYEAVSESSYEIQTKGLFNFELSDYVSYYNQSNIVNIAFVTKLNNLLGQKDSSFLLDFEDYIKKRFNLIFQKFQPKEKLTIKQVLHKM